MRVPILPTLVVAAAVAVMIGLGIWQLQRAGWKERLIKEIEAPGAQRQATVACDLDGRPAGRAGRNRAGEVGYRYLIPCGGDGNIVLDVGWSKRPDALASVRASRSFTGILAVAEPGSARLLVLDPPLPPLEPSAVPSPADLPNNHRLYAAQWFFFAAAAAVIYSLALRRKVTSIDR